MALVIFGLDPMASCRAGATQQVKRSRTWTDIWSEKYAYEFVPAMATGCRSPPHQTPWLKPLQFFVKRTPSQKVCLDERAMSSFAIRKSPKGAGVAHGVIFLRLQPQLSWKSAWVSLCCLLAA